MRSDQVEIFNTMLDANKERLYRLCRSYAEDIEDGKDLFQEVLLQIWKSLPGFREQAAPGTWVYRIALNTCMRNQQVRAKRNQKQVRLGSVEIIDDKTVFGGDTEERYRWLQQCLHTLNGTERALIVLYLEETPYKQIAEITGASENLVAVKIRRIKQKLYKCIKTKENDRK